MTTFHDETVFDRYQREHLSDLERYAAMSPLQIEALDIARHNAEAQRDELLSVLNEIHSWLVCSAIASADDMAQSFPDMERIAAAAIAKAEAV